MSQIEDAVTQHYTHGTLSSTVRSGLDSLRSGTEAKPLDLLAAVDEFHMGGRQATKTLADALQLRSSARVLDIGCGLGGTARYLASTYGCKVEGIDLTPEYVSVGKELNESLDLTNQISLSIASATDMPFTDAQFDRASMLHVGMNIPDKQRLMQEVARVLKPDALFGLYDVMRTNGDPIEYPVAWADDTDTSFVATIENYTTALEAAGFEIVDVVDKRDVALGFFEGIMVRLEQGGPPPLGLHIVMGSGAKLKVKNMYSSVQRGIVSPVQIIARLCNSHMA